MYIYTSLLMLRGLEFGVAAPSGAEWYVLVPKMCLYDVRATNCVSQSSLYGESSFTVREL